MRQFDYLGYSSLVNRTSNKAAVTLYLELTALPLHFAFTIKIVVIDIN